MLTARIISLLMGRNVVGHGAPLNGVCSHAHRLIGLEWSVGVVTNGLLRRTLGVVRQERRIQQPASVMEEWREGLSDTVDGESCTACYVDIWETGTIGQHGRLVTGSQPKS
jgi:hypothetical protein